MSPEEAGLESSPNWRDPSSYDHTRHLTREGWALEFLKRNRTYLGAMAALGQVVSQLLRRQPVICVIDPAPLRAALRPWGLHFRRDAHPPGAT